MGWLDSFKQRRAKRAIRKLPKFERGAARFRLHYPDYAFGRGSYGVPTVHDWQEGSTLKIGAYCSIAEGVQIFLGGEHRPDWVSTYPFPVMFEQAAHIDRYAVTRGDVVIGNDVWLCTGCTILSGVSIGDGAVIAAGALVTRDVEPYAMIGGNPGKVIGWRFDDQVREQLRASAWWNWPEEELRRIAPLLCNDQIDAFLAYTQNR
ncbi:chloramphenicol O-acetyltransferase [Pseudomonas sp. M47T1]|uniref:CatB-related O-acetyltransferase n=1 Tax=unclassified Pseudomonas TaxID=196821 RepID=UPI0002606B6B|nr:CatB-related O-acetyltransferase [Pseudomonas sp. M47T1]EIK96953.1 chloramphenicol O-acetyltransferase [Pseudomonas sp. M47T1]